MKNYKIENKTLVKLMFAVYMMAAVVFMALTTGCSKESGAAADEITVVSRESGSGTRGAFVELFGVEQSVNGKKVDMTADTADITNSTEVVITSVKGNPSAIGYISLGSLQDDVKALSIDGAEASVANIKAGSYKISRPFNIVTKKDRVSDVAADFIQFILSAEGQGVIEANGYIPSASEPAPYASAGLSGKVTVAGSSSVYPVMEKLSEAYKAVNPSVNVEVLQSDSTTGVNSTAEEICDIGMASRELKSSEIEKGLEPVVIALDGIAVIVNKENPVSDVSKEVVRRIYTGDITKWSGIEN